MRIAVSTSPGRSAVSNRPLKKSSACRRVRLPCRPGDRRPRRRAPAGTPATRPPDRRRRSSRRCVPRLRIAAMADVRHGERDQRRVPGDLGASARLAAWRVSAPISTMPFFDAMPVKPAHAVEVDQQLRRRQPHVERRDQALSAGQQPRLVGSRQQLDGVRRAISPWHRQMAPASRASLPLLFFLLCPGTPWRATWAAARLDSANGTKAFARNYVADSGSFETWLRRESRRANSQVRPVQFAPTR